MSAANFITPRTPPPPDYTVAHLSLTGLSEDNGYDVSNPRSIEQLPGNRPSTSALALPPPAPVVLSWNPDELHSASPGPGPPATPASPSQMSLSRSVPAENPPRYTEAKVPTAPVAYTFSPLGFNSMILIPPPEAQDTRPQYHISISMNCFNPSSYITTVRRGANENGDYVGEFEMGISDCPATLHIRGKTYKIGEALRKYSINKLWSWQFIRRKLYWNCSKDTKICYDSPGRETVYAKFIPTRLPNAPNRPVVMAQLEITPAGYPFFDDIILSGLIIERIRLTPRCDHPELFNYQP